MDTFDINNEINEEEINVEEIMAKIRENIRKRKGTGVFPEKNTGNLQQGPLPEAPLSESNFQRDLEYINSNWDIQNNNYFISSHRPVVGKFLVRGRDLVHGEIRRYVDPIVWKQTEFNGSTVRLLNDTAGKFSYYNSRIEQLRSEMGYRIENLRPEFENKVEQLRPEFENKVEQLRPVFENKIEQLKSEIDSSIRTEVKSIISSMDQDIENKAWLASILDGKLEEGYKDQKIGTSYSTDLDINYFGFEEQFRGSREDIKQRQSNFMNYFTGCSNVLDIGCGRGEFLELSKEHSIGAKGVDIDDSMVEYCLSKGFSVVKDEAISYLEKLDDTSLDGIFIDQVVEHLEPDYLIKLLHLCFQKLKHGYYIFVETVNPLSLVSFANFYIDMTHKKPIHPETLKFLLISVGFRDLNIKFISPVSEEARLKKVSLNDGMEEWVKSYLDTYNDNIEKLNNILYGAQDYAVIGKK
jgi:2-polyprenyl-3-methyl-5-hydroxy-6-metoxy-1,4-benzoquinol methylase